MIVLVDTREQLPLQFSHPYVEGVEKTTLAVGDYAVRYKDGHIPGIIFERKSIPDLFGSLSSGYKRFRKEINKAQESNTELIIIIEGTTQDILKGTKYSQVTGVKILRTLLSIYENYHVGHIFFRNREEMSIYIAEKFCARARKRLRNKNG